MRAGRPDVPVNIGLADRQAGNPRKHWISGQPLRKRPFYAGFRAGVVADIVEGESAAVDGDSTGDASFLRSR